MTSRHASSPGLSVLLLVEMLTILSACDAAEGTADTNSPLTYVRKDTWARTMLASRASRTRGKEEISFQPFVSRFIRGGQAPQHVSVDVTGLDTMWLVVSDCGDTNYDQAIWGDAALIADDGSETRLSALALPLVPPVTGSFVCMPSVFRPRCARSAAIRSCQPFLQASS